MKLDRIRYTVHDVSTYYEKIKRYRNLRKAYRLAKRPFYCFIDATLIHDKPVRGRMKIIE